MINKLKEKECCFYWKCEKVEKTKFKFSPI